MSRRPALRHRSARRIPATVAGAGILAVGSAAVWISVAHLVNGQWPSWVSTAAAAVSGQTWQSPWVIAGAVVLGLFGLSCLVAGLKPGPFNAWRLDLGQHHGPVQGAELVIARRGLARLSAARADLVDGVDRVTSQVRGRSVKLSVRMPATDGPQAVRAAATISDEVTRTVTEALTASAVRQPVSVRTVIR